MPSVPADPAVALTGLAVIAASPARRRVCLRPVLAAFAGMRSGSAPRFAFLEAHRMGFTFVTDGTACSRLLSTSPRGDAVAGHSRANDLIARMIALVFMDVWVSGSHTHLSFLPCSVSLGWAVRSARGSTSHATTCDPPPAERPAHLGWRWPESEMRPGASPRPARPRRRGPEFIPLTATGKFRWRGTPGSGCANHNRPSSRPERCLRPRNHRRLPCGGRWRS